MTKDSLHHTIIFAIIFILLPYRAFSDLRIDTIKALASTSFKNKDFNTSIELYQEAIKKHAHLIGSITEDLAMLYKDLSNTYRASGDLNKALQSSINYLNAATAIEVDKNETLVIDALRFSAELLFETKQYQQSIKTLNSALNLLVKSGRENETIVGHIYMQLGEAYYQNNDFENSELCYSLAMKIFKERSFYNFAVYYEVLMALGQLTFMKNDYKSSLAHYSMLRAIQIKEGYRPSPEALLNVGVIHLKQKNYSLAIDNLEKGASIALKSYGNISEEYADFQHEIGVCYFEMKDYVRSSAALNSEFQIRLHLGRFGKKENLFVTFDLLFMSCINLREYDMAFFYARSSQDFLKNMFGKISFEYFKTFYNAGLAGSYLNKLESAKDYFNKGLELQESIDDPRKTDIVLDIRKRLEEINKVGKYQAKSKNDEL